MKALFLLMNQKKSKVLAMVNVTVRKEDFVVKHYGDATLHAVLELRTIARKPAPETKQENDARWF